ncbi:Membrane protein involved in the export of O-antigen and teichoic acid [Flavobacterium resistens]|uniref:Membrane protein involved in the export of O-antigen and teichoic acid n=1 Tax=Flavobacterium resistens TaxID=443612 RepID=A0A521ES57_9FLAO|nr:oligosaccharide flippase family protein [Flavobacterium resistens]MRX67935.1 oligosaccharide flippase family protein [Flavobacterium resistens]SMO86737.1 Membrane protein involved in the export of O-antigen and teichoic acid [Flavobacterium resistens]
MLKNIIANYIGRIWGIISVFVFVPFYIKILGIESYAVINFYTVILTIMYFADGGLSATLNREIARNNNAQYLNNMLFTIERLYIGICAVIVIVIFLFSNFIASNWLNSQTIPANELSIYISLMGVSVAFQLFTTLESSGLMGLEKQVLSNGIQVSSSISRSALVFIPLYFFPSLLTFFLWQMAMNILFFFIMRYNLWKFIKLNVVAVFDKNVLKTVGKFAGGMMLMAIIASLNTQIDKIVISKILSLKEFGHYSLAGVLSQVPELIITPIAVAILPRMVKYTENKEHKELVKLFHVNSFILSVLATTGALVLFLFTKDFLFIWTRDLLIADSIKNVTKVLLFGGVFLSFQYMPYYLAIANGHTKTNVRLGIIAIIFIIPALIFFVKTFGLIGATFTWLGMNIIAYIYLGYFLIEKFLKSEFKKWLLIDTLIPLVVAVCIGCIAYYLTLNLPKGYYVLLYSVIIGLISLGLNLLIFNAINPKYKINIRESIKNGKL